MIKEYIRGAISKIKGHDFRKEYIEIKGLNSKDKLLEFQEKRLKKLLLHSYQKVPYYNDIFDKIGIVSNGAVDLNKFGEIPILTKELIRDNYENLISKDCLTRKWYRNSSGGSTGEPIVFIQDEDYAKWGNASFFYYYKQFLGVEEPNIKKVILWGSEKDLFRGGQTLKTKILNWLSNTVFLNSFRMTEDDLKRYTEIINSYKPDLIRGYAGSLYDLANYIERNNINIHRPKIIISSAEALRDEVREKIENAFKTKLYDFYGSRETNNLGGECKNGLIHLLTFNNYIEILDSGGKPVKEGEEGRVIVTSLHNYSMPLIRYEIEDIAQLGSRECECGNPLPTIKKIIGRITERFIKEDGTIISGSALTLTFNLKGWVRAFQIIQEGYKKVRFLVIPNGEADELDKKNVESKIKFLLGQDCEIVWEFVAEIPKTPQGKYLFIKSLIQK